MKELYGRRVILMHERANFFRITQSDHQTLKQFANSLREAAGHCNLETFNTEAALVLQFINGMKNEEIKLRLLAKENIELDEALSFLEMYEEIYGCNSRSIMKECYVVQETRGIKPRGVSSCGKQGDLAKVCKHPQKLGKSEKQRPQNSWKDHKLYADGTYSVKERAHNFEVTVKINGSPKRKRATVMLRSFTGHEVNLKGETMVTVEGNEKAIVRVAKNGATNVMGQDWINAFRAAETLRSLLANKKEVNAVESRTQNDVCAEFPVVFEDSFRHCTKISLSCPHRHGKKLNGKIPICANFSTGLNDRLMVDSYPTLRPEDLYQALRGGKTFTKLDLSEAYLQVELDEESKRIPVINTHKGLYHYNRLPFSVASALAIFQKVMDTMLAGIPNVAAYLDDIILTGATDDEHRRALKLVLGRLKEFGLRIRKEKCIFFQKKVEYLGHILSSKEWLIVLAADASNKGIGAVVYHRLSDGTVKVIAHASKKLNAAERNYGQIEKEALALVYGVKKLHKEELRSYFIKRTKLSVSYGCLLWGIRTVIPMKLRLRVLMKLQETSRLKADGCATAQKNPAKVAVEPWEVADRPWKRIHVDFAGPVNGKMFMIVVDAHSKWPFSRGLGSQKSSLQITERMPYHAQSNGQVEIFPDTFKRALKKSTNDRRPQKDRLREFLMTYRITPHQSTELTLSEMFLKRRIRTVLDLMFPRGIDNLEEQMRKMENTSGNRADRQFKIGETVMVHDYTRDRKLWREEVIVGQQGQVTWFVQVGRMRWKRHTNQMRHKNTGFADGQEEKDNEMGSLLDEAMPTGNSPNPAGENAQDIEAPNIFQDQIILFSLVLPCVFLGIFPNSWTGTHPSLGCTTALAMATGILPLGRRSNNHGPWHLSAEVVLAMTQHSVKEAK
ncbi:Uncharacterized protein T08_6290 [Trichinella sp. T8]|nr:Uncharacterized protein T08_6290 [Trichinella sp. T8]